jgi:hypothetical protein
MGGEVLFPHEYFCIPVFACYLLLTYCNPHMIVLKLNTEAAVCVVCVYTCPKKVLLLVNF